MAPSAATRAAASHRGLRPACGELGGRGGELQVDAGGPVDAGQVPGGVEQLDDAVEREDAFGPGRGRPAGGDGGRARGGIDGRAQPVGHRFAGQLARLDRVGERRVPRHPADRRDLGVHRVAQQGVGKS